MNRYFRITLLVLVPLFTQACMLAPLIQSFKEMGATPTDRERILSQDVKRFSELLSWGKGSEAVTYAVPEYRDVLLSEIKDIGEDEKVVETKVKDVVYSNDSYDAVVEAEVRYYKVPYYVVVSRKEKQQWTFTLTDGWKLKGRSVEEEKRKS